MDKHQNHEQLAGSVMKLPEEFTKRDERGDLLDILKHVPHGPVVEAQDQSRQNAQKQARKSQAGKIL